MFPTHVGIARRTPGLRAMPVDVPYACGDCAVDWPRMEAALRCSLRMWGLRVLWANFSLRREMFPTHVGIARNRRHAAGLARYVPYACGDCAGWEPTRDGISECSLRMWGLRGGLGDGDMIAAMFPTHVGIARRGRGRRRRRAHVPYACGDCADTRPGDHKKGKCSLRMWGLRAEPQSEDRHEGMFPTHVGIARRYFREEPRMADVPYACGDCAAVDGTYDVRLTCSLRMWGLRADVDHGLEPGPMFPTHVGIARRP